MTKKQKRILCIPLSHYLWYLTTMWQCRINRKSNSAPIRTGFAPKNQNSS